jgi:hypothetical protein
MPLQRKNWNVRGNDDEHRKQSRAAHLGGGVDDDLPPLGIGHVLALFAQPVHDVLNHDVGARRDQGRHHREGGG